MASAPFIDRRRGVWYAKWRPDPAGPWVRVKLGEHGTPFPPSKPPKRPPAHVQQRRDELAELERRAKVGLAPAVGQDRGLAGYVADYTDVFARTRKPGSLRLLKIYSAKLLAFAEARGVRTVQAAGASFCRDYLESRAGTVRHASLATEKNVLAPVWSRAVDDKLIPSNPWQSVKVPGKRAEHVPRFWTSAEVRAISDACPKPWQKQLVAVLANTGIRVSAVLAMRWDWIDWAGGVVTIPPEFDKAGKGYQIALTAGARDVLQPMCASARGDLLFPGDVGKVRAYAAAHSFFAKAVERSGVPTGTLHDLRHTFARHLAETAPLNVVQAALGHASLQMTNRYTKLTGGNTAKFVEGFRIGGEPDA